MATRDERVDVRDEQVMLHADHQLTVLFCLAYLFLDPRHVVGGVARTPFAVLVVVEREQADSVGNLRDI